MARVWAEPVKTALLAGLILLSLVLSAGIWRDEGAVTSSNIAGYVVPGNSTGHSLKETLTPRLIVHNGGRHYLIAARTRNQGELDHWLHLAAEALSSRSVRLLKQPVPAGDPEILELRKAGSGLELVMPLELNLSRWLELWGYKAEGQVLRATGSVPVQRIVLFSVPERFVVFLGGSRGRLRLEISEEGVGDGGVLGALDRVLRQAQPAGQGVRMLSGSWQHVTAAPGIFVPETTGRVTLYDAMLEPIDGRRLADAVFPDPGMVRRMDNRDGSTLFTDGQGAVRISPGGLVEYSRPGSSGGVPKEIIEEIDSAAGFIDRAGGWPDGAFLLRAVPGVIEFTYTVSGLGVFRAGANVGEMAAPIRLETSSSGVLSFSRWVWRAAAPVRAQDVIAPEDALSALDIAISRGQWGQKAVKPLLVRDIYLAYLLDEAGEHRRGFIFKPVWVIEDGEGQRIPIDAVDGSLNRASPDKRFGGGGG